MQYRIRWAVAILVIAALQLSACAQAPTTGEEARPASLEPIEGTDLNRVTLTEKAADLIGLQTAPLREEQVVRTRTVGGEVVALPGAEAANLSKVWVRVRLNERDLSQVDRGQPAFVQSLDDEEDSDEADGLTAEPDEGPGVDDAEDNDSGGVAVYYVVDNAEHGMTPGQRVLVELTLSGSGTQRKVVPYAAVIYGEHGETWVFVSPEPLVFVRQPIVIDYIEDDRAVLSEGPDVGTAIVTVGAEELYGSEFEFAEE